MRWPQDQTGESGSGLPGAGLAVGGDPQDLAAERVAVLGQLAVAGLAGRDVEVAVGAEREPAAVVDRAVAGCR